MAEESPRPAVEEDSEEEEEGEEAAEAPAIESRKNEASSPKNEKNKPPVSTSTELKPKENRAPVQASPVKPLLAAPSAFQNASPALYTPPALPTTTATPTPGVNIFANDGSFLELFKKKMEQKPAGSNEAAAVPEEKKPEPDKRRPISFVGKRRGGAKLALKTGMVAKKPKTDDEEVVVQKGGAWAQYMAEVKKYKAHQCSDDDKTRPLVK